VSFPAYSKYKDSGVAWLGRVPEHWEVPALGYRYHVELGKMLDEKRITGKHLGPYLRNTDVQWGQINIDDLPSMDFEPPERERFQLKAGDLLVCEGGEVGRAALWRGEMAECFYQKALHRIRPRSRETDTATFLYYLFHAAVTSGVFTGHAGKSTIAHLPAETLRRYRFGFPPLPEQQRIAAFLDRETGKIDELVAEQRRLLELMKEKRQAVISHAVTKGLNPAAPLKPSGIPASSGSVTCPRIGR
jgi:type I restriction enzyme, S subunit